MVVADGCVPIRWSGRNWALPFLTILAPSARWSETHRTRHKTLTDWARQAILQTKRWLPNRWLVFVADSGFAVLELLAAVRNHVCVITRLRLDAALVQARPAASEGPTRSLEAEGKSPAIPQGHTQYKKTVWASVVVSQWYNAQQRKLLTATGTALWYKAGVPPVPIRWVLVRDPTAEHAPAAFLSDRSDGDAGHDPRLVRLALACGNHIPGGPHPPRRGDPASVVRSRHTAHYPNTFRPLLFDHPVGR